MPILVWNIKGACTSMKKTEVRAIIKDKGCALVAILETKINSKKGRSLNKLMPEGWEIVHNLKESNLCRVCVG